VVWNTVDVPTPTLKSDDFHSNVCFALPLDLLL
jgi:hypothetical protein